MSRVISAWDPEETPATTTTKYVQSTKSAKSQQAWVNPPSNTYEVQPSQAITILPNAPTPAAGTPGAVVGIAVGEAPYKAQDGTLLSLVSVSFTPNPADSFFDHVVVWFEGYNGSSSSQSMTQGSTSPIEFLAETTGETVRVTLQAVSIDGKALPLSLCTTALVTLNGVTTAPPSPTIVQTLTTTPTGYQFQFSPVPALVADQIRAYQVLRSTVNNVATSACVYTFPQPGNGSAPTITVQDTVPNGQVYFYWVISVNTLGLGSAAVAAQTGAIVNGSQLNTLGQLINADQVAADGATYARILANQLQANHLPGYPAANNISNPMFVDTSGSSPSGSLTSGQWIAKDWQVIENDNGIWFTGVGIDGILAPYTSYLLVRLSPNVNVPTGTSTFIVEPRFIPVRNGDIICAGWAGAIAASTTHAGISVALFADVIITDINGTQLAEDNDGASINTVNTGISNHAWVYPVNFPGAQACFAKLRMIVQVTNTTGSTFNTGANLYCDARFSNILFGIASNTGGPAVAKYGSMPVSGASPLNYTTTTTSVTFGPGSFTGYRTDVKQTPFSSSYSQACTGLTANTHYTFYPYWDDNVSNLDSSTSAQSIQFAKNSGVISGGVGTPAMAFPLAGNNQALQFVMRSDHIPIGNGPIAVTTPTSGTGGGSGGGGGQGGQGTCPRADMLVLHNKLGVISAGKLMEVFREGGEHYIRNLDSWTKVTNVYSSERSDWLEVDFGVEGFVGTPHHNWPTEDGMLLSADLNGNTIQTVNGKASHKETKPIYNRDVAVRIEVESPHTYLCGKNAPILLTHNPMLPC